MLAKFVQATIDSYINYLFNFTIIIIIIITFIIIIIIIRKTFDVKRGKNVTKNIFLIF